MGNCSWTRHTTPSHQSAMSDKASSLGPRVTRSTSKAAVVGAGAGAGVGRGTVLPTAPVDPLKELKDMVTQKTQQRSAGDKNIISEDDLFVFCTKFGLEVRRSRRGRNQGCCCLKHAMPTFFLPCSLCATRLTVTSLARPPRLSRD